MNALEDLLPTLTALSRQRHRRVGLDELAADADRSPSHYQRTFTRLAGESPKQFQRRLQLELAAALLLTTDRSVLDIALEVGFDSHEGFTRAFKSQFARPPRAFRSHGHETGLAGQARHARLITSIGPCIRLFHAALAPAPPEEKMSYDITRQSIPETTVLFKKARVAQSEIASTLAQILPAVFGHCMQSGAQMMGPPFTRYLEHGPGLMCFEAGLPVAPGTKGTDEIEVATWAAGEAYVTIHTGPYETLGKAYAALETHLRDAGETPSAAPREIYLTDPGEVPDPNDWKTQVIWPVVGGG